MARTLLKLLTEEDGQDLVEYALVTSAIAFAGIVGMNLINAAMNTTYTNWDEAVQSDALVEVPDPQPIP